MRKTVTTPVTEAFRLIKQSAANSITPNVFKFKKKLNFIGECIVIKMPSITAAQLQKGTIHINYHVPNLKDSSVNPVDESLPDLVKLEAGAAILEGVFNYYSNEDYVFELSDTLLIEPENSKEHYINIRVLYRNANI